MSLWIPEQRPPLASENAVDEILQRVQNEGVISTSAIALDRFETDDECLADKLDRISFEFKDSLTHGLLPERMLKIGASLAWLVYHQTGYSESVSKESIENTDIFAYLEDTPDAYFASLWQDRQLLRLLGSIEQTSDFPLDKTGEYGQLVDVGAGYVRYYLQGSLVA